MKDKLLCVGISLLLLLDFLVELFELADVVEAVSGLRLLCRCRCLSVGFLGRIRVVIVV